MADSPHTSVENHVQAHLHPSKRLHAPNSIAETRRGSRNSIKRLKDMIALQEDRMKKIRHQLEGPPPPHIFRLRTSMKDLLLISKHTLAQLKTSAENLELSWAMLHWSEGRPTRGSDHEY